MKPSMVSLAFLCSILQLAIAYKLRLLANSASCPYNGTYEISHGDSIDFNLPAPGTVINEGETCSWKLINEDKTYVKIMIKRLSVFFYKLRLF